MQLLTDLPVPALLSTQLDSFSKDSVHSEFLGAFDSAAAVAALQTMEGQRVLAADFGGDKGATRLFEVRDGRLQVLDDYSDDIQGDNGQGYVDSMKKSAAYAEANNIPFGISWGGPMDGSKLVFHPKAKIFMAEMQTQFDNDLKNISPSITAAINDGPAGLIQGAVEAYRQKQATSVLFMINGGGLGMAVAHDKQMFATEAGHVAGAAELNTYGQTVQCGVFDATYTCVEQLGANKAGIEAQWQAVTGSYMRARDIEDQYKVGNDLARDLYDHSALIVAHVIYGTAQVYSIDLTAAESAIVCHGGAFKFPHYGERVQQILTQATGNSCTLLMSKDFTDPRSNACLDGAAIAALTTPR